MRGGAASEGGTSALRFLRLPFAVFTLGVLLCTAPGHLWFPDEEIVYQTTESLAERGSLAIDGIPKRTGEPKGRPAGTFGWAPGRDGRRYGFFGHGLSFVAMPLYVAGRWAAAHLGPAASHLPRSDHYVFHRRNHGADVKRLFVSLTNAFVTTAAAWWAVHFFAACGAAAAGAVVAGLCVVFGTVLWAYAGTFLSEPLSALCLTAAAWALVRARDSGDPRQRLRLACAAAVFAGGAVHVHVLNVVAVPFYLIFFLRALRPRPRGPLLAAPLAVGAVLLGLLGLDHYLRFGDPFETGRYGHYSRFVAPWPALAAFVAAPGRSFFLFAPAVTIGLTGWAVARRRAAPALHLVTAIFLSRLLFAASRSDWWGGWSLGPRYLVPLIPLCGLPLALRLSTFSALGLRARVLLALGLAASVLACGYLALYSPFEHMHTLMVQDTPGPPSYLARSHWSLAASPWRRLCALPHFDVLPVGALRLWRVGHPGPLLLLSAVAGASAGAGAVLVLRLRTLARRPGPTHPARHGATICGSHHPPG